MNENDKFALVQNPSSAVEKTVPGAKRMLGLMVSETLAIAQQRQTLAPLLTTKAELEKWYHLGQSYYNGEGVPQDYAEAVKWFRLAAERGHALAQYYFGICCHHARGVPEDYVEAIKWYRKAGAQGVNAHTNLAVCYVWRKGALPTNTEAKTQIGLGDRYTYGNGVPQDCEEGIKYYLKAAGLGDNTGLYNLAFHYSDDSVTQPPHTLQSDYAEAYKWFKIAADTEKDGFGKKFAGREMEILSAKMTAEQIREGERRYREFSSVSPEIEQLRQLVASARAQQTES